VIENPVNVYTELNEITFNVINSVKQAVQKSIIPMDDIVLYKKKEHWATNRYFPYGDCEENVRMNYSFLLQNGFLPENLNVAFVTVNSLDNTKQPEGHLVLLVTLMLKDRPVTLVVDNLQQRVIPISQATHLTFYSMLTSDRKRWVNIRVKN
jgi:predicted transglutaminase-like cysteine proteinase